MQSATGKTKQPGKARNAEPTPPPAKKGLRPITIIMGGLIALASIGIMAAVLLGFWPPKSATDEIGPLGPTPVAIIQAGFKVEKAGPVRIDPAQPGQFIVPVKVTNNVVKAARVKGTPTPGTAAPTAGPAKVLNADIRVIFYRLEGGVKKVVGGANGNATDIEYGQSKVVEIVGTGIENPQDLEYEVIVDFIYTNKDTYFPQNSVAAAPRQPASAAMPRTRS